MSFSKVYVSAGYANLIPLEKFTDYNANSHGFKLELSNKTYCKLWYGLQLDYIFLKQAENPIYYFEKIVSINTFVKYAPFTKECYNKKLIPYLQATFGFSSISPAETFLNQGTNLGLGYSAGLGLAYNFTMFKKCIMLEVESVYFAPNEIMRDESRENLQSIKTGINLGVGL